MAATARRVVAAVRPTTTAVGRVWRARASSGGGDPGGIGSWLWAPLAASAAGLAASTPEQRPQCPSWEAADGRKPRDGFLEAYRLDQHRILGNGQSGVVCAAVDLRSGTQWAVKSVAKSAEAQEEVDTHWMVSDHPNIVALREVFEDGGRYHMVMQLERGGELYEHLTAADSVMEEGQKLQVLREIAEAVAHLHSLGIVHHDIKPENILLTGRVGTGKGALSKLGDFGSSFRLTAGGGRLHPGRKEYTAVYSAPEVVSGEDRGSGAPADAKSADVWALGVLAVILMQGHHPFDPKGRADEAEIVANIIHAEPELAGAPWDGLPPDAVALIRRMLAKDPSSRPSAREVLDSPWLANARPPRENSPPPPARLASRALRARSSEWAYCTALPWKCLADVNE